MFTLPKSERLKGKAAISALMTKGRWGRTAALKYCCMQKEESEPNKIMVSVPFLYNINEILSQEELGKQVEDILHGLETEDKR